MNDRKEIKQAALSCERHKQPAGSGFVMGGIELDADKRTARLTRCRQAGRAASRGVNAVCMALAARRPGC